MRACEGSVRMSAWCAWSLLCACALSYARELDPAACAARFDVQRDKIIRTEESRDMGARYLSELDVGSRHECRRLCCETDACDVFVYEEKVPGSCYLFNCGPPEDFRCKFTAHSNFSSGVLALSRRLAELQDQERLAHRVPAPASPPAPPHPAAVEPRRASSTSTVATPAAPAAPPTPAPPPMPAPAPAPRRCSRYQFECHNGGECIAVYNACDGVPQCADGSDEAPELGCPAAVAPPARPAPQPAPAVSAPVLVAAPPASENGESGGGSESIGSVEVRPATSGAHWPHRLAQAQPPRSYTETSGSHIFSHKGGLLQMQEAEPGGAQYVAFEPPPPAGAAAAWPRRGWPRVDTAADAWGGAEGGGAGPAWPRAWPEPRRAWPVPAAPPPDAPVSALEPENSMYAVPRTMPEMPMTYSNQHHALRDSPKKGLRLEAEPEMEQAAVEPPPAPTPRTPPAPEQPPKKPVHPDNATGKKVAVEKEAAPAPAVGHAAQREAHDALLAAAGELDGLSEHPPAAVLLLVLGILMTSAMGVMVACRARAARRRMRRGGKPFAHDADYLVNGMYL